MDTQNANLVAKGDSLTQTPDEKVVVGAKQLRKAFNKGCVKRVYLARNADPAITEPLVAICNTNSVNITWVKSMTDLGQVCGIEVGAAAAAVIA